MSELHNAASQLGELGYEVFPCVWRGKNPATPNGFHDATCELNQIDQWWTDSPNANLALHTAGLVLVDVDPIDGKPNPWLAEYQEALSRDCGACAISPRGGYHYFFRQPEGADYRSSGGKIAKGVDIRANGGYVVLAPSYVVDFDKGIDGPYRWIEPLDCPVESLPVAPGWLLALLDAIKTKSTSTEPVAVTGEQIPNGQRNDALARMAGNARRVGATVPEISALLQAVNADRCKPPLSFDEVEKIAKSVGRYEPDQAWQAVVEGWYQQESTEPRFKVYTSDELDRSDFHQEELIQDVLMARQPTVAGGPPKCCKTLFSIDLTLSLASGSSFLGHFRTMRECRVALFSGESGGATIQESARRIAKSKPWWNLSDYKNALWSFDLPTFNRPGAIAELKQFVLDNGVEVLVMDPTYLMLPVGDSNKNVYAMGEHLRPLSELAAEINVTPIIVNHFVKSVSVTESPPGLADLSGAGFAEWARQWILVSRRTAYDLDRIGHHELWLGTGGSAGHGAGVAVDIDEGSLRDEGGRRWEVSVTSIGRAVASAIDERKERAEQQKREHERQETDKAVEAIVKALKHSPEGLTFTRLRDGYGISRKYLNLAIDQLDLEQRIERCEVIAKNKRAFAGVRLLTEYRAESGSIGQVEGLPALPDSRVSGGQLPL